MKFGSLFSGIGGMDLGLERAGMQCVWQVESDDYARRVLAKHWPHVRRHDDVRTFPLEPAADWACDLMAGGFPCQPVSVAGRGRGTTDERWLWPEFARVLRMVRPRFALLENVPGLLVRGMGIVLGDLAELGFDAEWACVSACSMGFTHMRRRLFIVAYRAGSMGKEGIRFRQLSPQGTLQARCDRKAVILGMEGAARDRRGADGLPPRMVPAVRGLGNAVVPQISEWLGQMILAQWVGERVLATVSLVGS